MNHMDANKRKLMFSKEDALELKRVVREGEERNWREVIMALDDLLTLLAELDRVNGELETTIAQHESCKTALTTAGENNAKLQAMARRMAEHIRMDCHNGPITAISIDEITKHFAELSEANSG